MINTLLRVIRHEYFAQSLRYIVVGLSVNILGYLIYLFVTYLGGEPKVTMSVMYGVGVVVGFFCHRNLTFASDGCVIASGIKFLLTHIVGYLINLSLLIVMVDKFGFSHQWVQAVAIVVVAIFLFIAFKFYVFRDVASPRDVCE